MILIRTHAELSHVIASSPDPELQTLLTPHAERLADYLLEAIAEFVIVQPGDTLAVIEEVCNHRLVAAGAFLSPVELIAEHTHWIEVVWILSDDGYGLVALISKEGTDLQLLAACRRALLEAQPVQGGCPEP